MGYRPLTILSEAVSPAVGRDGSTKAGKPPETRSGRSEPAKARVAGSDSEIFWVTAAATAYSLEAFKALAANSPDEAGQALDDAEFETGDARKFAPGADVARLGDRAGDELEDGAGSKTARADLGDRAGLSTDRAGEADHASVSENNNEADAALVYSAPDLEAQAPVGAAGAPEAVGSNDVYWRQTEAVVSEGHAVEITDVAGNVVFEGLAEMIGLGGAAVKIEAEGSVQILAEAALAGRDAAIDATSTGDGDVSIEFTGAAVAGAATGLDFVFASLEERLNAVEAALSELEEVDAGDKADAALAAAESEDIQPGGDELVSEAASPAPVAAPAAAPTQEAKSQEAKSQDGLTVSANDAGGEIKMADETVAVIDAQTSLTSTGGDYLRDLAEAVEKAVETVVDSFDFAPEFVDGAIGQLANASAVGVLANTRGGGVNVVADGVVLAEGDAMSLSSEEGQVAARIDGLLVGGGAALVAEGDEVRADLDGAAVGAKTGVSIEARTKADVDLDGVVRSGEGVALRVASEGDVELRVDGAVYSAGGVGLEVEAARDAKVRIDGVVEGGLALTGVVDGARLGGGGEFDIDIRGEISGGRAAFSGSAAAISVDESFGADVRLTVVGDSWVEAGFVGLERDAAIRLGSGADRVEIEGRVVGDVLLGDGDDLLRLNDDGHVDGVINGGRGADVFVAGDLADVFEMTFGAGFDTVHGFSFGDRFDFRALAEYNDCGAAAMLETHFWDEGQDVATLGYFDGVEDVELTLYGDDLDQIDFDDVFVWI